MFPRVLRKSSAWALAGGLLALIAGCDWMPGRPKEADRWEPPEADKAFGRLFATNCQGCHGNGQTIGASMSLNNPLYLAMVPREVLYRVIAEGIPGSLMPEFSKAHGGDLTDEQITALVDGIIAWGHQRPVAASNLPPYSAPLGKAAAGAAVYTNYCASCHGTEAAVGPNGSVLQRDYLRLVSDQYLRTIVIAGRPELGMPNYLAEVKPMSSQEISDLVAWLASHRESGIPANEIAAAAAPLATPPGVNANRADPVARMERASPPPAPAAALSPAANATVAPEPAASAAPSPEAETPPAASPAATSAPAASPEAVATSAPGAEATVAPVASPEADPPANPSPEASATAEATAAPEETVAPSPSETTPTPSN